MLQSLNYDSYEDFLMTKQVKVNSKVMLVSKLLLTIFIAFVVSMCMYLVRLVVEPIMEGKFETTLELIADGKFGGAFFFFVAICVICVGAAASIVSFVAPLARGGGVPYVMAYLNGTNVRSHFAWRIVAVKTVTVGLVVAGGMTLGMEGPFVYIGAGVAMLVTAALDHLPPWMSNSGVCRVLKSITEERVFMSGGLAAGLAVAFNAPIAGILMALEGSTAFLTVPTVIRIFGCAMFALFFNILVCCRLFSLDHIVNRFFCSIFPGQDSLFRSYDQL